MDFKNKEKEQDPLMYCLQEICFSSKDTHTLKVKEWKMIFQGNGNQKMVKPYLYPIKETSSQK